MPGSSQSAGRATVTCFGVGDGLPSADRYHSSYLYQFEKAAVLIDCGEPISRSYKGRGLDYDLVDNLFISHLHFDHVGGFFMLMQSFWLEERKKPLIVHAPGDAIAPLRQLLQAGCIFDELLGFKLQFEPLRPKQPVQIGPITVTPFPTTHLADLQRRFQSKYPQSYSAFCFQIESPQGCIGHSADIGAVEDLTPLFEHRLELLVCELAHISPDHLFAYLRGRAIGGLALIHLSREWQARQVELAAQAKEMLGAVPVSFPQDGDELELNR